MTVAGLTVGDERRPPRGADQVALLQRQRAVAPGQRVDDQMLARVADICVAVDGLPLALELAAARTASYTLEDIAAQVAADPSQLSRNASVGDRVELPTVVTAAKGRLPADLRAARSVHP